MGGKRRVLTIVVFWQSKKGRNSQFPCDFLSFAQTSSCPLQPLVWRFLLNRLRRSAEDGRDRSNRRAETKRTDGTKAPASLASRQSLPFIRRSRRFATARSRRLGGAPRPTPAASRNTVGECGFTGGPMRFHRA